MHIHTPAPVDKGAGAEGRRWRSVRAVLHGLNQGASRGGELSELALSLGVQAEAEGLVFTEALG